MKGTHRGLLVLVALVAMAAAWKLQGDGLPPPLREAWRGLTQSTDPLIAAPASQPPRKCLAADGSLLYSSEACPAGMREQAIRGGTVTVLQAPPRPPASSASAQPLLHQLVDQAEIDRLRERRLDQALKP